MSPYRRSEMRLTDELLQQTPDHSVALFDKGFWGAELLSNLGKTDKTQPAPNSGQKKSPYLSIRGFSVWSG